MFQRENKNNPSLSLQDFKSSSSSESNESSSSPEATIFVRESSPGPMSEDIEATLPIAMIVFAKGTRGVLNNIDEFNKKCLEMFDVEFCIDWWCSSLLRLKQLGLIEGTLVIGSPCSCDWTKEARAIIDAPIESDGYVAVEIASECDDKVNRKLQLSGALVDPKIDDKIGGIECLKMCLRRNHALFSSSASALAPFVPSAPQVPSAPLAPPASQMVTTKKINEPKWRSTDMQIEGYFDQKYLGTVMLNTASDNPANVTKTRSSQMFCSLSKTKKEMKRKNALVASISIFQIKQPNPMHPNKYISGTKSLDDCGVRPSDLLRMDLGHMK